MAKVGQSEVIEHLCFYQHLCLISSDGFQSPAFAKPQTVSGNFSQTPPTMQTTNRLT